MSRAFGLPGWLLFGGLLALPAGLSGQSLPEPSSAEGGELSVTEFVERARAGTSRYRDRAAAIVNGYRALGPDFPAMGEHWINPGLVLEGRLNPSQPQILLYATVGGRPELMGVAYAIPVAAGESTPNFPMAGRVWHFHSGTVDDESFLPDPSGAGHGDDGGLRVAVLHAWIWLENPAGIFEPDNWALPYARLGFAVPERARPEAAMALSLTAGGEPYYIGLLRTIGRPDAREDAAIRGVLASYRAAVEESVRGRARLPYPDVTDLADLWWEMWAAIEQVVTPGVRKRLARIHRR